MKKIVFVIVLMMFIGMNGQGMMSSEYWQKDKIMHCAVSFGISSATYTYLSMHPKHKEKSELSKRIISLSTATILGALKEVYDSTSPNNFSSWGDIGANAVGAICFQASVTIPLKLNPKNKRGEKRKNTSEQNVLTTP
ncbi:hypothetical protein [Aquimarina pacifica]|uniref:hypothetical protein n=1 Tax=Aquimarina pacifica TaxID=1296415 RepID=UPI0004B09023|nr:hypothetical protein [Aquimarina pacifica]